MSTTATKSVNRGFLKKMAAAGRLWVKCSYRYTDDYAWDAATNFGQQENFVQVYLQPDWESPFADEINRIYNEAHARGESVQITRATVEPLVEQQRRAYEAWKKEQSRIRGNRKAMGNFEFGTKSGCVRGDKLKGDWCIHTNLSYEYEIR